MRVFPDPSSHGAPDDYLDVNGKTLTTDAADDTPLLWVLRDDLNLTGTKFGCGMAQCGACTVHIDGQPCAAACCRSRQWPARRSPPSRAWRPNLWARPCSKPGLPKTCPQCGYCQSGQIMSATALLAQNKAPTDADIDAAMTGNICRCGTYVRIRAAIHRAAAALA
jgi:isoquinoline 1-oxidoreductase alpha subunit